MMTGKLIFLIVFVCILPIAVLGLIEVEQKIQDAVDACAIEHGYPSDKYEAFVQWYLNLKLDFCVAACTMRKTGTLSHGVFTGKDTLEFLAKYTDDSGSRDLEEVINKCANEHGNGEEDDCKTVKNLHDCLGEGINKLTGPTLSLEASINQILIYNSEILNKK